MVRTHRAALHLSAPALPATPAADLQVRPFDVQAATSGTALMPSTRLSVRPFDVRGSTGESSFAPATSFEVKPFDIRLGFGGLSLHIRPFSLDWE